MEFICFSFFVGHTFKCIVKTKNLSLLAGIQDYEQGIVIAYGSFTRLHLFRAANHHEIVQNMVNAAQQYMNITLKVVPSQITLSRFEQEKFGAYSYVYQHWLFSSFFWNLHQQFNE